MYYRQYISLELAWQNVCNICMHPVHSFSILMAGWMICLGANIQARLYKLSGKDDSGLDVGYKRKIGVKSDVMFLVWAIGKMKLPSTGMRIGGEGLGFGGGAQCWLC